MEQENSRSSHGKQAINHKGYSQRTQRNTLSFGASPQGLIKAFHIRLAAVQVHPPAGGGTRSARQRSFIHVIIIFKGVHEIAIAKLVPFASIGKRDK